MIRRLTETVKSMAMLFLWSSPSVTRSGPHIRDRGNVKRFWNTFVAASAPAWLIGCWSLGHQTNLAIADFQLETVPGWRALLLSHLGVGFDAGSVTACFAHGLLYFIPILLVALLVGAIWEALFATIRNRPLDEGLLYFAWFFTLLLPATVPLYQVALGASFGLVFGKLIYGGSGRYLVNPVLLALAFLVFSYPDLILGEGVWVPVAGYDQPTVLELVSEEGGVRVIGAVDYSYLQIFLGDQPGSFGVVSPFGALIGAVVLYFTGVVSWRIMLGSVIGLAAMSLLLNLVDGSNTQFAVPAYWHLVLGGFAFGTVFLATDPVAGPITDPGRWGFGLLVGALTVLIRASNPSYYEGIMFAILLASVFSPLIDFVVTESNIRRRRRRLAGVSHE